MARSDDFMAMLESMCVQEGAVVIAPHQREFRRVERDFLDKLRHIPSRIKAPPRTNPYSMALGHPGKWMMVWIPDAEV